VKKDDFLYLADIQEALKRIMEYSSCSMEDFLASTMIQDAIIRNFEIMGEASKRLSNEFREAHPEIPWSLLARTRDRFIHHYAGVRMDILWSTIQNDLPLLQKQIGKIMKERHHS